MREPEMTQELQAELHQGVLVRFFGGFYVAADADGQEYTLRCPKKFRHQRLSPLVGDAVRFHAENPAGKLTVTAIQKQ